MNSTPHTHFVPSFRPLVGRGDDGEVALLRVQVALQLAYLDATPHPAWQNPLLFAHAILEHIRDFRLRILEELDRLCGKGPP